MTSPGDRDQAGPTPPATGSLPPTSRTGGPATSSGTSPAPTAAARPTPSTRPPVSASQVVTGDWPAQAADRIVDLVDTVRDKTTGPVQTAARAAVYGVLAAILGVIVFVLLIIFAIRGLDILVDEFIPWGGIWLPYLILGVVFLVAGSVLFRRRRRSTAAPVTAP